MEIHDGLLAALFGVRCVLMALTLAVAYAYSERVYEFAWGRTLEDRLGTAVWLFAIAAAGTNMHSAWLMIIKPGEFHGSVGVMISMLCVMTLAHYLVLTAWAAYRFEHPIRSVVFNSASVLAAIAVVGGAAFFAYLTAVT